ncbi:MAG: hypothetical protein JST16_18065 [Bdellovibrionales bacterium]|nr:hypothetical protein [Bdellovibrionales bacterium]
MQASDGYKLVTVNELRVVEGRPNPADLYVYMPATQSYFIFISAGEMLTPDKFENLKLLSGSNLFLKEMAAATAAAPAPTAAPAVATAPSSAPASVAQEIISKIDPGTAFDGDVLGEGANEALKAAYKSLLDPNMEDAGKVARVVTDLADNLLRILTPESPEFKTKILKSLRNLELMNHTSAITSLAVLCAVANDFRSRTALQNLCHAALLMDAGLAELEDFHIETYYRSRKELPTHIMEKVQNHPVKSQMLAAKLPIANETVNQLILMHHELNNGQGYHRGLRTANFAPLSRVLALAVDIYEMLKGSELRGTPKSLKQVLLDLQEKNFDAHTKRHSAKIVEGVYAFLGIKPA